MVGGVIAEFNIFHNGHKYLIDEARKEVDSMIAVMSGSFVQRGDAAITDKWLRARAALMCGVDLVIELPVCYALNAAPWFAEGSINTLAALGVTDTLFFGSECGDTETLKRAAQLLENESAESSSKIKAYMSEGMSYPSAVSKAYGGKIPDGLLDKPNNILALEYIRAVTRSECGMNVKTVKRVGAEHDGTDVKDGFASASMIREMLTCGGDVSELIPYPTDIIGESPYLLSRLDSAFAARLRSISARELQNISEVGEGIENRILAAAMAENTFDAIAEKVKSKRYTMSRIRRILIASLIGFTKDIYSPVPEYIRVLGMSKTGAALLKKAKKNCPVPIITKTADFKGESKMLRLDLRATDIHALCAPVSRRGGADFTHSPVIM